MYVCKYVPTSYHCIAHKYPTRMRGIYLFARYLGDGVLLFKS